MGTWLRIDGTVCVSAEALFNEQNFSQFDLKNVKRAKRMLKKCFKESWQRVCGTTWSLDQNMSIKFFGPKTGYEVIDSFDDSVRVSSWNIEQIYVGILAWHRNLRIDEGRRFLSDLEANLKLNGFSLSFGTRVIVTQDTSEDVCMFSESGFRRIHRGKRKGKTNK